MDEIDKAQAVEDAFRSLAIAAVRVREELSKERPTGFHGLCTECESPLPGARIDAGYYRCVECVAAQEQRKRLGL